MRIHGERDKAMALNIKYLAPEALEIHAAPLDFKRIVQKPNLPTVDPSFGHFSQALQNVSASLGGYGEKVAREKNQADKAEGFKAALLDQATSWREAIQKGLIDETASPFWQKGYEEAKGRLAGYRYRDHLQSLYEMWDGKSAPDSDDTFMGFLEEARKGFLKESQSPDWLNGFRSQMEAVESHMLERHAAEKRERLKSDRLHVFYEEALEHLQRNPSIKEVGSALNDLKEDARFVGMNPKLLDQTLNDGIMEMSLRSDNPEFLGLIKAKDPETAARIQKTREKIERNVLAEDARAFRERARDRKIAKEEALEKIANAFETHGPGWEPDQAFVKKRIEEGVTDVRARIEAYRKVYQGSALSKDVDAKNAFYRDLYEGKLNVDEILEAGSSENPQRLLSLEETKEALKLHANRKLISEHPLIKDVKRTLANQLAPGMLDQLMNALPDADPKQLGQAYQALEELDKRLLKLKKNEPEVMADPGVLLEQAQSLREEIVGEFKAHAEDVTAPQKPVVDDNGVHMPELKGKDLHKAFKDFKNGKGPLADIKNKNPNMTQKEFEEILAKLIAHQEN